MTADISSEPETRNQKPYLGDFSTTSADQTFTLAMRIGEQLTGGEVFLLSGDLGAGKTVFAKGLAAGLGIEPTDVTSPSFTLVNSHAGRLRFVHVDLYRLDPGGHGELGLEEILDDPKTVTAIEWAERLSLAPESAIAVNISYVSTTERGIAIR